jgi:DNA-binding XRE family transcriptional regulator
MNKPQDTSLHQRMHKDWLRDPEYRAEYDRARAEIAQVDALLRELDRLRADAQISKAELARRIGRNESSIRRLFTADQPRPELPLVISIAQETQGAQGTGSGLRSRTATLPNSSVEYE